MLKTKDIMKMKVARGGCSDNSDNNNTKQEQALQLQEKLHL